MTSYRAGLISRPRPVALVENRLAGKAGGGRPKSARSAINKAKVQEMSCSQDDQPDTSKSTRQISGETGMSAASVSRSWSVIVSTHACPSDQRCYKAQDVNTQQAADASYDG